MKKLIIIGIVVVIIAIISFVLQFVYLQGIDTKYAIEYSKRLGSHDISQIDTFLNEYTTLTYKGETKMYKELRPNIITAFNEKKFIMAKDSSYGHGTNYFIARIQTIKIQSYINLDGKSVENYIEMQLEKTGFKKFRVKSLSSDDEFFGYLFFGISTTRVNVP